MESLTLVIDYNKDSRKYMDLRGLSLWWSQGTMPCKSRNLRVCDVSFRGCDDYVARFDRRKSPLKRIQQWDEKMVPALVLNYYRHVTSSMTSGIIPIAMQSINMGNVYQKTTNHIPYDMRISNSGLIFHVIRNMAK
jgi:hypothetical protein